MKIGKAYGFFRCTASKEAIEAEIPAARHVAQTPSPLELSLQGSGALRGDRALIKIAQEAQENGINYVVEATYPGATHEQTATELGNVVNNLHTESLYEESRLHGSMEPFYGEVFYKHGGGYASRP